jgi:class 3 adenylate cyclase/tetratricopeptide (TPR) repeat protein
MTISAHRKVVTVVFCDVVGSTALGESVDPEALQGLLARYFERMKGIVESHGGSVEKFIGDAVMAVFGVPVAHEDDALRACRAAVEMRDALPELGVEGRIGVNTGEVLTGTEERLATGDAVNVAARLEQAAEAGEVLIGAETLALVGIAVEVGDERLLELKGKSEPVAAYPLASVNEAAERSHASGFVGRERELQQLADAWDRALAGPRCEFLTVMGDPGVGKSRLVAEALARIDAKVVRGRCLSYGDGITYWPVVEVVKQLAALPSDEEAASAIRSLLGEGDVVSGTDEIAWAFRKLLEEQAPLVVCFDDIQWGEETFLGLVESTALLSTGAPILLVCMARPELLDRWHTWPSPLRLEPLGSADADELIGDSVSSELRGRIADAAGGNPLFIAEMLAMSAGDTEVEVPPTLQALLAARLDQLDPAERNVLERGSVEGEIFHRGAVQTLAPEEAQVTTRLAGLVRRELIRPDRAQLEGQDGYRFRHLLIRDAAYNALPKSVRADLHQRFAAWLNEHGRTLVELDEILGYHLEQAAQYLSNLGRPDATLAREAARRLAAAALRARGRDDARSARSLLARSIALDEQTDVHVLMHYAAVDDSRAAALLLDEAAQRAELERDAPGAALARAIAATMRAETGEVSVDEQERLALAALPLLEAVEDHDGLTQIWVALGYGVYNTRCQYDQMEHAAEEALRHAALAGRPQSTSGALMIPLQYGSRPVPEALERVDALAARYSHPGLLLGRAVLLAMNDEFDAARTLAAAAEERFRELNDSAYPIQVLADIEELAGNFVAASELLRIFCEHLADRRQTAMLATYAPLRGRVLCALGRHSEAEQLAAQGRELGDKDDPITQSLWRRVSALVHAQLGDVEEAERLAREALAHAQKTDSPQVQGDTLTDLAEVLETAGRGEEAAAALRDALDLYERKQIIPLARRVRERLAAAQAAKQ